MRRGIPVTVMDELRERRDLLVLGQEGEALLAGVCGREWRAIEVGESDPEAMLGGCRRPEHEWSTGCR
jgi:hypothetical protein